MKQNYATRREFLCAGGVLMTSLSFDKQRNALSRGPVLITETKIREIMERYGSELGNVRREAR